MSTAKHRLPTKYADIGARLREVRETRHAGMEELNQRLGLFRGAWGTFERGERAPTVEQLKKISEVLNVNLQWLLTGEVPEAPRSGDADAGRVGVLVDQIADLREEIARLRSGEEAEELVTLPVFEQRAAAGPGEPILTEENVVDRLPVARHWFERRGLDAGQVVGVTVSGDSMAPELTEGDVVFVLRETARTRTLAEAIYVLRIGGELLVKRLVPRLDAVPLVVSTNPDYPPFDLPVDEPEGVDIIGRAVGAWKAL